MTEKNVRRKGFTLIELLVVIAIIALLAAILFPVFARARANARRSVGLSNLKQIGLGLAQYLQDNDGRFPPHVTERQGGSPADKDVAAIYSIRGKLQPYVKSDQIFKDPSAPAWPTPGSGKWWAVDYGFHGNDGEFTAGGEFSPKVGNTWYDPVAHPENKTFGFNHKLTESLVSKSSEFIIAADSARPGDPNNPSRGGLYPMDTTGPISTSDTSLGNFPFTDGLPWTSDQAAPSPRHLGGTNFLFADGHAKWLKLEKTWVSKADNFWRYDRP